MGQVYIRGRSQRIQRRREIISQSISIIQEIQRTARDAEWPTTIGELANKFTVLMLELTELNAIDDQKVSVRNRP